MNTSNKKKLTKSPRDVVVVSWVFFNVPRHTARCPRTTIVWLNIEVPVVEMAVVVVPAAWCQWWCPGPCWSHDSHMSLYIYKKVSLLMKVIIKKTYLLAHIGQFAYPSHCHGGGDNCSDTCNVFIPKVNNTIKKYKQTMHQAPCLK